MNYLEQLVSEWLEYQGYFVRKNIRVGKRPNGGYDCELDIVAFNPEKGHLIHIEPSTDTHSWAKRELRYKKKFEAGLKHIPDLFRGMVLPEQVEQQAIFLYGSRGTGEIGGGKVLLVSDFLKSIQGELKKIRIEKQIVPENFPLIRTLHIYIQQLG